MTQTHLVPVSDLPIPWGADELGLHLLGSSILLSVDMHTPGSGMIPLTLVFL